MTVHASRYARKLEFLHSLAPDLLAYLVGKERIPANRWQKEPQALRIVREAKAAGVYASSTTTGDILSALRNLVRREGLQAGVEDPARAGSFKLALLYPDSCPDDHLPILEKLLGQLAAYAATLAKRPQPGSLVSVILKGPNHDPRSSNP
jgi:hypothetical protein